MKVLTEKKSWEVPDGELFRDRSIGVAEHSSFQELAKTLFHANGSDHSARRRPLAAFFTPRATAAYEQLLQPIADRAVNGFAETVRASSVPCDAVQTLVYPLMGSLMGTLLGLPHEVAERLARAGEEILLVEELWATGETAERADVATDIVLTHFRKVLSGSKPTGGLLAFLWASARDSRAAHDEALNALLVMISAAPGTSGALVSSTLLALSRQGPERRDLAGRETAFVDEVLRLDPPGHVVTRVATRDTLLAGVPVARGTVTHALIGCAGRDPVVYADPDKFDFDRAQPRSLVFSAGPHYCLGAGLARLQVLCLVTAWRAFAGDITVADGEHPRLPGPNFRQLTALPMVPRC